MLQKSAGPTSTRETDRDPKRSTVLIKAGGVVVTRIGTSSEPSLVWKLPGSHSRQGILLGSLSRVDGEHDKASSHQTVDYERTRVVEKLVERMALTFDFELVRPARGPKADGEVDWKPSVDQIIPYALHGLPCGRLRQPASRAAS